MQPFFTVHDRFRVPLRAHSTRLCLQRKSINDDNNLISATCSSARRRAEMSFCKGSLLWSARLSAQSKFCSGANKPVISSSPQVIHVLIELVRDGVEHIIPVDVQNPSSPFRCASTVHNRTTCTQIRPCVPLQQAKLTRNHYPQLKSNFSYLMENVPSNKRHRVVSLGTKRCSL